MSDDSQLILTAVPGLDVALGGGLLPHSLLIIVGQPGAGKTVLASQILFEAARRGERVLILSTYSEGHEKLMAHLESFAFFDEGLVARQFTLLPLTAVVGDDMESAGRAVSRVVRETRASIVLIDGFQGMAGMLGSPTDARRFLATISTLAAYLDVTLVLTVEGVGRDPVMASHLTTGDVVLSLEYTVEQGRHCRRLDVLKQRGMAPLRGLHTFDITSAGIIVFPRLESLPVAQTEPIDGPPAAFGLPTLDALLDGGLTAASSTVLAGAPGAGKTILGLAWAVMGARQGEEAIFIGMGEQPGRLQDKAATFGLVLEPLLQSGALRVMRFSPAAIEPDIFAAVLLGALRPSTRRLVIDDLISLFFELGSRARPYLAALKEQLAARGVTVLLLHEIPPFAGFQPTLGQVPLTLAADNVLVVQEQMVDDEQRRALVVLKMRYSGYARGLHELVLAPGSIDILTATRMLSDLEGAGS